MRPPRRLRLALRSGRRSVLGAHRTFGREHLGPAGQRAIPLRDRRRIIRAILTALDAPGCVLVLAVGSDYVCVLRPCQMTPMARHNRAAYSAAVPDRKVYQEGMRFGLALPQYDFSLPASTIGWDGVAEWAKKAEALGFGSVWLSDHLFYDLGSRYGATPEPQGAMECLTTLAAVAAVTEKVRLGSLVVCNDFRSPALVAKMTATADVISRGRVEVGLGAGWFEAEYRAAGIGFDPPGVRIRRLSEAVQIVDGMLSDQSFSFEGKHYKVTDAWNLPGPVQSPRPPIWVGGKGDYVVSVAGRYADGFNTVWAWTPEDYAGRIEVLERAARKAGRDPATIRRSVGLHCLPGAGAELTTRWKTYLAAVPGLGDYPGLDAWRQDKLCGDAGEMLAKIDAFRALGVEEVILSFGFLPFQIADPEAPEWFAREVISQTR